MKIIKALFGVMIMLSLCSCGMIDFREKALATETKVIGFDAEIPGAFNSGASFAIVRLGYISNKYMSAPDGGKASIKDEYNDVSIWTLSGNGKSKLTVENDVLTTNSSSPATAEASPWQATNYQLSTKMIPYPKIQEINDKEYRVIRNYRAILPNNDGIKVNVGFVYDGASIPRLFWSLIGSPFTGTHTRAAFIHDALYAAECYDRKTCEDIPANPSSPRLLLD